MTRITRVTVRETDLEYRGDKLVVQLLPKCVCLWRKNRRDAVYVRYDVIFELGQKIRAKNAQGGKP